MDEGGSTVPKSVGFARHAWVAQPVKCPALDFGPGYDLRVSSQGCEIEPYTELCSGCGAYFKDYLSVSPLPLPRFLSKDNKF